MSLTVRKRVLASKLGFALVLMGATPAQARDDTISSFDGTRIVLSFFPADNLRPRQRAPTVLFGPGWSQGRPTDSGSESGGTEGLFGAIPVRTLRAAGYNVLTWDPRGFGESGGTVTVDSPDAEGRDVRELITYVSRQPEALLDAPGDPRAGMTGASYGGGIQLVVAALDQRLDAIVPDIAWNSLETSLYKDHTFKGGWSSLLYTLGVQGSKNRLDPHITSAFTEGTTTGQISDENVRWFRSRGPGALVERIRIPTFLTQGTVDTLFTLDESARNYAALRRNGVPTKLMWFCGGHGTCLTPSGPPGRLRTAVLAWLGRWLRRNTAVSTGPRFEWLDQDGHPYAGSDFPLAAGRSLVATGSGALPLGPGPGEGAAIASARAANAVNVAVPRPAGPTHLVGAPQLTLAYSGTAAPADVRIYAQLVDDATGIVLGNQVTPIPLTLDGTARTVSRPLEVASALAKPGSGLTVQLFASSNVYDLQRAAGAVTFSNIRLRLPTADPSKAPPGYPGAAAAGRRRAGLRIGAVAGLARRRRPRSLQVLVRTVNGSVRNVVVTLRGRRGRLAGRSRPPRTFSGRRRFAVRLRRALARGRYVIEAVGRRPDGSRVRVVKRVRRSR
jgi:ABC-2 type transport system ATP-binding protein